MEPTSPSPAPTGEARPSGRPTPPPPAPEPAPIQHTRSVYTPAPAVTPPPTPDYGGSGRTMWYVGGTVAVLLLVGGGVAAYFMLRGGDPADRQTALPVEQATPPPAGGPTPSATATPELTPEVVLNKGDWKFVILNGSGVAGAAAEAKPKLEELGYTVVQVGNADTQDYTETKLFVSDLTDPAVQLLLDDLQTVFPAITVSDETLEESDTVTARVILGA